MAPISELDSREMVEEIHGHAVLEGARGQPVADEVAIRGIIQAASSIMMENDTIQQMDLNPVIVYPKGANIVDARIILGE